MCVSTYISDVMHCVYLTIMCAPADTLRNYILQLRQEIGQRLAEKVYTAEGPSKVSGPHQLGQGKTCILHCVASRDSNGKGFQQCNVINKNDGTYVVITSMRTLGSARACVCTCVCVSITCVCMCMSTTHEYVLCACMCML